MKVKTKLEFVDESSVYVYAPMETVEVLRKDDKWQVKRKDEETWRDTWNVIGYLMDNNESLETFEKFLDEGIINKISYGYMVGCKFYGQDIMDKYLAAWSSFGEKLASVIDKALKKSKFTVLKGGSDE